MSRSDRNDFFNEFSKPFSSDFTTIASGSTTTTLVVPAAGKHLRLYSVTLHGPTGLGATQEIEVRDNDVALAKFYLPADGVRELDFLGRYYKMADQLTIHQGVTQEPIQVVTLYRVKDD